MVPNLSKGNLTLLQKFQVSGIPLSAFPFSTSKKKKITFKKQSTSLISKLAR